MAVSTLIKQAKGDIWGSVLRCDFEGYVPPMAQDWLFGKPPIDYLRPDEQPHFYGIAEDRVLKVRVNERRDLKEVLRVTCDRVQEGKMYNGWTGYLSSDSPYCSIFLVTDQRILIFVGQKGGDQVVEFPYEDPDFTAIRSGPILHADGYRYKLRAFSPVFKGVDFKILEEIFGPEVEVRYPDHQETGKSTEEETPETEEDPSGQPDVSPSDLLSLTPIGFEEYVADIWREAGYDCEMTPQSADDGIDIIADSDNDRVLIQVKRYSSQSIGIKPVQRMAGLLVDNEYQADRVIVATTSHFTRSAQKRARQIDDLSLLNGEDLVERGNDEGVHLETKDGITKYDTEISRDDILDAIGQEPLRTVELQKTLDANPQSLIQKLQKLNEDGEIEGKHLGDRQYIWYLPTQ